MCEDTRVLTTLLVYFLALALCFWRLPQADRWHIALCAVAAILWTAIPVFNPQTRTLMYGLGVLAFLMTSLSQPIRRRVESRTESRVDGPASRGRPERQA